MTQVQLAVKLDQLIQTGSTIFIKINPEVIDFARNDFHFDMTILSKTIEFEVEINSENYMEVLTLIRTALFENDKLFIVSWNIKNLFTYVLFKTGHNLEFETKLLDLKLAECFIGIRERAPFNFEEVLSRLKVILADSSWNKFKSVYQKVYRPLITTVIPKIEIEGIFHTEQKRILFSYYEIEGQVGGRLACQLAYENCFNPHSLSDEEKRKLQPKANGLTFVCFDYHFHEVCILAWLSKDELLEKLVSEEGDFYRKLYTQITGNECNSDIKRSFCKDYLFLPVIYGQSIKTLADRAKVDITVAEKIIRRLHNIFPKLFVWLDNHSAEDGVYKDYIGRKRRFLEGEEYKYRNFIIQSPGAIFCLDKLVALHNALGNYGNIVAHIHDGYVVRCEEKHADMVRIMALKALESESGIFPGLKLRTNCKISRTLA